MTVVGACSAGGPTPATGPTPPDDSSLLAPLERANEVANQVNQRESDLETIYKEMNR